MLLRCSHSPYLEIRIIYMYLYSFIINKLNLNIMFINLDQISRPQDEIDFLYKYWAENCPVLKEPYQWYSTLFFEVLNGVPYICSIVEEYNNEGIIEQVDVVSIPYPPEFQ